MERFQKYLCSNLTFNCSLTTNWNMYGASTKYCLIYIKYEMTLENAIGQTAQNNPPSPSLSLVPVPTIANIQCKQIWLIVIEMSWTNTDRYRVCLLVAEHSLMFPRRFHPVAHAVMLKKQKPGEKKPWVLKVLSGAKSTQVITDRYQIMKAVWHNTVAICPDREFRRDMVEGVKLEGSGSYKWGRRRGGWLRETDVGKEAGQRKWKNEAKRAFYDHQMPKVAH